MSEDWIAVLIAAGYILGATVTLFVTLVMKYLRRAPSRMQEDPMLYAAGIIYWPITLVVVSAQLLYRSVDGLALRTAATIEDITEEKDR